MENTVSRKQLIRKIIMKEIWVTSDQHWFQESILKFKDEYGNLIRPEFSTVDEMDETMVERWNSVVKPYDKVYHLGDFFYGEHNQQRFLDLSKRLNGKINLIIGNHDSIDFMAKSGAFNKVQFWRKMPEFGILLSHVPQHINNLMYLKDKTGKYPNDCIPFYGIHGHIHRNISPTGPYRNVCVEVSNYTPINIETLASEAKYYLENRWEVDIPNVQPSGIS